MEEIQKHLYVLILAGGGGTRLWPMSRESNPKQFLRLFHGKSLFQLTYERALKITSPDRILISTSAKYISHIKREVKQIKAENLISEPQRKDTALALGVPALYIYQRDPQAVIVNMTSDHLITPLPMFVRQMKEAACLASTENQLVAIGIKPRFPHTGLGHVHAVKKYPGQAEALIGTKFVEKPALPLAIKYTQSGEYYWNAGIYIWRADLYLHLLETHSPKTSAFFSKLSSAIGTDSENQVLQLVFQMAPSISVDYAVSEKLHKFICIPGQFNWTDVGDWKEVWNNLPQDSLGNVISGSKGKGEYAGIDSENNLIFLDKQLIATVGLHDFLIVGTPDAILICPKDSAQAVKKTVEFLREKKLTKYL